MESVDTVKYTLAAGTLKLFSAYPQFYRLVGNVFGARRRIRNGPPKNYLGRFRRLLSRCEKHHAIQPGDRALEVGTGWVHWESIIIRLFYDIEVVLFDVWDNRQLEALKRYVEALEQLIATEESINEAKKYHAYQLIAVIQKANSFDELYQNLGFQYVVDKSGTLKQFQNESFNLIYSSNVLEHVHRGIASDLAKDIYRLLKPGGFSIHTIDLTDHIVSFARVHSISRKNYLKYPDKTWKRYFENSVQYINRIQRPEWLKLFAEAGFELVDENTNFCSIEEIEVANMYAHLNKQDLACKNMTIVHRKPLDVN